MKSIFSVFQCFILFFALSSCAILPAAHSEKDNPDFFFHEMLDNALKGDVTSQHHMANLYLDKNFGHYSESEAVRWLHIAANNGSPEAWQRLGEYYQRGYLVPKNDRKAFHYIQKAAMVDMKKPKVQLALMHQHGMGTPVSPVKAYQWAKASCMREGLILAMTLEPSLSANEKEQAMQAAEALYRNNPHPDRAAFCLKRIRHYDMLDDLTTSTQPVQKALARCDCASYPCRTK